MMVRSVGSTTNCESVRALDVVTAVSDVVARRVFLALQTAAAGGDEAAATDLHGMAPMRGTRRPPLCGAGSGAVASGIRARPVKTDVLARQAFSIPLESERVGLVGGGLRVGSDASRPRFAASGVVHLHA